MQDVHHGLSGRYMKVSRFPSKSGDLRTNAEAYSKHNKYLRWNVLQELLAGLSH